MLFCRDYSLLFAKAVAFRIKIIESRLLDQVEPEHRLFLLLIAVTGLRLSEALGFRWQDFEPSAGTLSVTHRLWRARLGPPKTKKSRAKIQLARELVEALADRREASDFNAPEDFIFCKLDGAPLDPDHLRREMLHPAMDRAGIMRGARTHGFHILRHTAASLLHERTHDLKGVQEFSQTLSDRDDCRHLRAPESDRGTQGE